MVRTDINAKNGGHHGAEVTQGLDLGKGAIAVEAGKGRSLGQGAGIGKNLDPEAETGRSQDLEAGIENEGSEHVPDQDPDTGIGLEAGADQRVEVEIERRELKNQDDLAEA